jgi:hypothetical protein
MSMPRTKSANSSKHPKKPRAAHSTRKPVRTTIMGQEIVDALSPQNQLLERMLHPDSEGKSWLVAVGPKAAKTAASLTIDYPSFRRAYRRLCKGERPRPLPKQRDTAPALFNSSGLPTAEGSALAKALENLQGVERISISEDARLFSVVWKDGSFRMLKLVRRSKGKSRLVDITYNAEGLRLMDSLPPIDQIKFRGSRKIPDK